MRNCFKIGLFFSLCLSASGCILLASFDPTGTDVSLAGEWHIDFGDGPQLADATSCADAGIGEVELRIYDDEFSTYYTSNELRFDCAQGAFDTRPLLLHGRYRTRWLAYDINGFEIARSEKELIDVTFATAAHLPPPTFSVIGPPPILDGELHLALEWDSNIGPDIVPDTCGGAKVDALHYIVRDGLGQILAEGDSACTETLIFDALAYDTYSVEVLGAEAGFYAWSGVCEPLTLDSPINSYSCLIERRDF